MREKSIGLLVFRKYTMLSILRGHAPAALFASQSWQKKGTLWDKYFCPIPIEQCNVTLWLGNFICTWYMYHCFVLIVIYTQSIDRFWHLMQKRSSMKYTIFYFNNYNKKAIINKRIEKVMGCSFVVICWVQTTPTPHEGSIYVLWLILTYVRICNILWLGVTTVWHPIWIWPSFPDVLLNTDQDNFLHILEVTAKAFFAQGDDQNQALSSPLFVLF